MERDYSKAVTRDEDDVGQGSVVGPEVTREFNSRCADVGAVGPGDSGWTCRSLFLSFSLPLLSLIQ